MRITWLRRTFSGAMADHASRYVARILTGLVVGLLLGSVLPLSALSSRVVMRVDATMTAAVAMLGSREVPRFQFVDAVVPIVESLREQRPLHQTDVLAMRDAIDGWMLSDPVACLNFLCYNSAQFLVSEDLMKSALDRAAAADPRRIISLSAGLECEDVRSSLLTAAYLRLVESDPAGALTTLGSLPAHLKVSLGGQLADSWGQSNGAEAAKTILASSADVDFLLHPVLNAWARVDPAAALEFLANAPDEQFQAKFESRNGQMASLFTSLAPEQVVDFLMALPPSAFRDSQMVPYVGDLLAKNPEDVRNLTSMLSGSSNISNAIAIASLRAARRDPASSLRLLELIPGERARGRTAARIAGQMVQRDKDAAMRWVSEIRDPLSKDAASKRLLEFGVESK